MKLEQVLVAVKKAQGEFIYRKSWDEHAVHLRRRVTANVFLAGLKIEDLFADDWAFELPQAVPLDHWADSREDNPEVQTRLQAAELAAEFIDDHQGTLKALWEESATKDPIARATLHGWMQHSFFKSDSWTGFPYDYTDEQKYAYWVAYHAREIYDGYKETVKPAEPPTGDPKLQRRIEWDSLTEFLGSDAPFPESED